MLLSEVMKSFPSFDEVVELVKLTIQLLATEQIKPVLLKCVVVKRSRSVERLLPVVRFEVHTILSATQPAEIPCITARGLAAPVPKAPVPAADGTVGKPTVKPVEVAKGLEAAVPSMFTLSKVRVIAETPSAPSPEVVSLMLVIEPGEVDRPTLNKSTSVFVALPTSER